MPYKVIWEHEGLVFRFSGVVSDEELIASNDEVYTNRRFPAMKYQIVDFSAIDKFDVSANAVRQVADMDRRASETNPDVRVAIITSAIFVRGMSNMYALGHEARGGSWITELFESEENARTWAIPSWSDIAIDVSRGLVVLTPSGDLTLSRAETLISLMTGHPDFAPGMPSVWDLREADLSPLDSEDLRQIAAFSSALRGERGNARVAAVSSEDLSFGITRMYEVVGEVAHLQFKAFRDFDEAVAWVLDVPEGAT